jgi:hypothetical protein
MGSLTVMTSSLLLVEEIIAILGAPLSLRQ